MSNRAARFAMFLCTMVLTAGCSVRNPAAPSEIQNVLPGRVVDVKATEFFFDAPDSIPAGLTTFRLEQTGLVAERVRAGVQGQALVSDQGDNTRGMHMLWVVRLDESKTVTDLQDAARARQPAPWAHYVGGPAFIPPPNTTNATLLLEPGNYALVCYVGSGREDVSRFHVLHGMVRALTVTARTIPTEQPAAHTIARVTAPGVVEFSRPLRAGSQLIQVNNQTPRDIEFTFQQYGVSRGGLSSVPAGLTVLTTIVFTPGEYVLRTGFGSRHTPQAITIPND